jgi:hypothetical protein
MKFKVRGNDSELQPETIIEFWLEGGDPEDAVYLKGKNLLTGESDSILMISTAGIYRFVCPLDRCLKLPADDGGRYKDSTND